ncbi:phenylalanine--tRNA ligase beta subunit [Thalassobaculum fulvum]|uniref:Phenylalanine--tRNA ligase beta subunit n=1 Tax=Thalassobaculum fulvum TaxID=1633335 RepID=A0A919CP84_9PROT|nr:phenylalanine--tRNA ligase subunit beta [Thalassobaculum fulvum]GHD41499.1 phenylalanine--tRNA ligase beta subunit [Thalassobaculum fulvum]
MKFTLSWLKAHLDTDASLTEITDRLTMLGLELEGVEDRAAAFKPFRIAHVVEAVQHPNADRLRVCKVDAGDGVVQVVCGAPNARTGMKGVFAPSGTHIPGTGIDLKKGVIRGEESNGMLLSERELGLSDDHEGIIDLPADAPTGANWAEWAGLDDPVIDVAITPNRGDCLGVRGIARDLAAAGVGTLKPLDTSPVAGTFQSPLKWRIDLPSGREHLAPIVAGRYFRGVRNGPSPKWMQDRLRAVGLRPISALVDITNYVMLDLGRPLHAYDPAKVTGDLVIRLARPGEKYLALNGREYAFDEDMLVIGDDHGPDDLAGVMGGERSGVSDETTDMFLEVAIFDPTSVAATGRKLGLQSDARYRFERGLDQTSPFWGAEVATRLVQEICGGEASELVVAGTEPDWRRQIPLRHSRIAGLCGVEVPEDEARRILGVLGFEVSGAGEATSVTPPPWRGDIDGEADLVEEVVRVFGYDEIRPVSLERDGSVPHPALTPEQNRRRLAKRALAGRGLIEAVTFSFLPAKHAALFGGVGAERTLVNPISADLDVMRPAILPNLLAAAARNANQGYPDLALFEVGPEYAGDRPEDQAWVAAGLRHGRTGPRDVRKADRAVDVFDAKADAVELLEALEAPTANLQVTTDAPSWYHPGRSGCLRLGPKVLARFGELHPRILEAFDLRGPAVAFEVLLDVVPMPKRKGPQKPLLERIPFQALVRDFAFVVAEDVPADKVARAAAGADKALIDGVRVFDEYRGKGLPEDSKSIAIEVTLQPRTATLTDEQIEAVARKIVEAVGKHTGGTLRG